MGGDEGEADKRAAGQPAIPADFVHGLFDRVPREDLARYSAASLADIAVLAHEHFMAPRHPGAPAQIALADITVQRDDRRRDLTILDIVNDDRPYLLDSTLLELGEQGFEPRLVAHPIFGVERDSAGEVVRVVPPTADGPRESFIHIHLDRLDEEADRTRLVERLAGLFADVTVTTDDEAAMRDGLAEAVRVVGDLPSPLAAAEVAEAAAFLDWLRDDHMMILGLRVYRHQGSEDERPEVLPGLGLLRDPSVELFRGEHAPGGTPEIRAFLRGPAALLITKTSVRTRVHKRAYLDMVGIKLFADDGALAGEMRLVGLFSPSVYTTPAAAIPYLRRKVAEVIARAGLDRSSHAGRALADVLETYPRDELFQIDVDLLSRFATTIAALAERPRARVLIRTDPFGRFVSVLVYLPKDRYDTALRRSVGRYLVETFDGRLSAAYPDYPDGTLARTHYIIGLDKPPPAVDAETVEAGIAQLARTWSDGLRDALEEMMDGPRARTLANAYAEAFSVSYRDRFSPADALADIAILDRLNAERPRAADIVRRPGDPPERIDLKVFSRGVSLPLSARVPALENLGFTVIDERTYRIHEKSGEGERVWLHDMALERAAGGPIDLDRLRGPLEAALMAIGRGLAESDAYNRLVIEASLGWRDVALLRALGRYQRQIRVRYGQDYLAATLSRHPAVATGIVALFYARFDPRADENRDERQAAIRAEIEAHLAQVTSLDEDRILRRFVNLVGAARRTSFFQLGADGLAREAIAFKFACADVEGLPLPRPLYEIFVYSPRVEGLHLRFGYVARGGLRWSDRPEDFRTEILGLVKAQQVKNAVIVPVGAKGGFFPKRLPVPGDRQAWLAEGTESYRLFVASLLDVTDNIVDGEIVPPPDTVRHDPGDAYLVVAADKGTATFSDTANAISIAKGHWLGDAFASGGSHGYDHKAMGITARGAWEAVRRHFAEMDVDVARDPVSAVGIGDMSGDVFGNGMLLSESLRLVAAFDHRHIFLDPDPEPGAAIAERRRLFALPRSSWADYDPAVISPGGGVFSRDAKSIPLSEAVQARLGIARAQATPAEVIQAILMAPVDLLWFGGIGTYVRASTETDDEVGDRANDAVRISGAEVRARVIGEGANLGVTQRGRIEAARRGVRLNTDAIDNSAGVNTSDVEVNIKIALSTPQRQGLLSEDDRNALVAAMTEEVAELVLRNNRQQTLALSLASRPAAGASENGFAVRLMQMLEAEGRLDRAVEFLPSDAAIAERSQRGEELTRPEFAVLLAYAKLSLKSRLLDGGLPDDPVLELELDHYFPHALRERFPEAIAGHRLRREIIATELANAVVNLGGPTIVPRLVDETGATDSDVAAAYVVVRDVFGLPELHRAVERLDRSLGGEQQLALYAELQDVLRDRMVWVLRNADLAAGLGRVIGRFAASTADLAQTLPASLGPQGRDAHEQRRRSLADGGVPEDLAERLASLRDLAAAPDIILVAEDTGRPLPETAATYYALADRFQLEPLAAAARRVPAGDIFDRVALERAIAGIGAAHRALCRDVIRNGGGSGADAVGHWCEARGQALGRTETALDNILGSGLTLSKVMVATSLLGDLGRV